MICLHEVFGNFYEMVSMLDEGSSSMVCLGHPTSNLYGDLSFLIGWQHGGWLVIDCP